MVNKPLIRPYFWGGYVRGGRLTSHDYIFKQPPRVFNTAQLQVESNRFGSTHHRDVFCNAALPSEPAEEDPQEDGKDKDARPGKNPTKNVHSKWLKPNMCRNTRKKED